MGGEEDGGAFGGRPDHFLQHDLGGDGIQAFAGFVENQQLSAPRERQDQRQLRAHAFRELLHFAIQGQLKPGQQFFFAPWLPGGIEPAGEGQHLAHAHISVQQFVLAHEAGPAPDLQAGRGIRNVAAQHLTRPGSRTGHA